MKKIFLASLLTLMMLLVVGCTKTTSTSKTTTKKTTTQGTRDSGLPTDVVYNNEDSVMIHYQRKDNKYNPWSLWLWAPQKDGARYEFNYQDDFGVLAYYPLSTFNLEDSGSIGFIIAKDPGGSWSAKDTDDDRFIDLDSFEKDSNKIYHVYLFNGDKNVYANKDKTIVDKITEASFKNKTTIEIKTSNNISEFKLLKEGVAIDTVAIDNKKAYTYTLKSTETFAFDSMYQAEVKFTDSKNSLTKNISITNLFDAAFDEEFYYDGELGAIYTSEKTTFKVWSPVSKKIELNIYENGTPVEINAEKGNNSKNTFQMTKGEKGVFSYELSGDVEGVYYTYTVYNAQYPNGYEVVDPYAKSTGVNGLRGMVVDFSKTNPEGWNSVQALNIPRTGMVIYELHVADLTSSTTWGGSAENAKKYLGLIEEGTTYTKGAETVSTGFDHIKELRVNAVQLLPIFDQANDETNPTFNWGYNPLNYNTLEGVYSSDPYNGYTRIIEFKKVVQAYNKAGINIIMDVVYNHVNGAVRSNFDVLVPGYYFRYTSDGALYNGSGCGNETASDHLMFRKFMIDSTTFWLGEYKLGGFRFDLMGLHDIETMNKLVVECEKVNPHAVIFGEPWTGGTSGLQSSKQAVQDNETAFVGFGAFNDKLRDELVKGGLSDKSALSWISNTQSGLTTSYDSLIGGIKGNTVKGSIVLAGPEGTINYATCHDNYTLSDRFKAAGVYAPDINKKMSMLANAIVLTSQGTSFILSGEEFLRTKGGNSNSYNASYKINELDYSLKIKNYDMFVTYCSLIIFKTQYAALQLTDTSSINVTVSEGRSMISYKLDCPEADYEAIVIHKNGLSEETTFDLTGYYLHIDTLGTLFEKGQLGVETIEPYQTIVAIKLKG